VEFDKPTIIKTVVLHGRLWSGRVYNPKAYTVETSDVGGTNDADWQVQATMTAANVHPIGLASDGYDPTPITTTLPAPVVAKFVRLRITESYYITGKAGTAESTPTNTQIKEISISSE
jgi:hypothetical protein